MGTWLASGIGRRGLTYALWVRPSRRRMYHVSTGDAEKLKTAFFIQALINGSM